MVVNVVRCLPCLEQLGPNVDDLSFNSLPKIARKGLRICTASFFCLVRIVTGISAAEVRRCATAHPSFKECKTKSTLTGSQKVFIWLPPTR